MLTPRYGRLLTVESEFVPNNIDAFFLTIGSDMGLIPLHEIHERGKI